MVDRVRSILLLVLVTLLVWIYAEAESLTRSQQEVRVSFVSGADDVTSRVVNDDWRGVARVRFEGSAAALQRTPPRVELRLGAGNVPDEEGEFTIDLAEALRADTELQRAGVNVLAVEPPTVRLRVDALRRFENVPVRAALDGIDLEQPPRAEPATASVLVSRAVAEQLDALSGGVFVLARVDPSDIDTARRGATQRVRATLSLPAGITPNGGTMRITPAEAIVEITVRRDTASITVPSAPVQVLLPPTEAGRWNVRIPPEDLFVRNIEVVGPSEFIARLRSNEVRLVAVLSLSSDDLDRGITEKQASIATLRDGMLGQPPQGVRIDVADSVVRLAVERLGEEPRSNLVPGPAEDADVNDNASVAAPPAE